MPPLRERRDDILMLAEYFLEKHSDTERTPELSERAKSALLGYSWPGNVRELQNVINRFLTIGSIELREPSVSMESEIPDSSTLNESVQLLEKNAILKALQRNQWHIGKAAAELGFSRRTMQRRMVKYRLR